MFTGIIEEVGVVREIGAGRLVIGCRAVLEGTRLGDSIAINGVDLTVTEMTEDAFTANVMPETYRRSALGDLEVGSAVNLERALTLSKPLGGHLVRGVVEGTGELVSLTPDGDAVLATYRAPADLLRYMVVKGPVTVDGASLTVVAKDASTFTVSLVQYTQHHTNLTRRKPGDRVNLETDIIARYVEQLLAARA